MRLLSTICLTIISLIPAIGQELGELPASVGTALQASNDSELTTHLAAFSEGQHIELTGSLYTTDRTLPNNAMIVNYDVENPPTIRARYTITGDSVTLYGLEFDGNSKNYAGIISYGDNVRIIRNYFHGMDPNTTSDPNGRPIVVEDGDNGEISFNEIYDWGDTPEGFARQGIYLRAPRPGLADGARYTEIAYNYLRDQNGYNPESYPISGGEVIQLGGTQTGNRFKSEAYYYVHHNYIKSAGDGDNEGFGVKASYSRLEYNHLDGARGFHNRYGGYNTYIGNRVENIVGSGSRINRGGYNNLSLGEYIEGVVKVEAGDMRWEDLTPVNYLRSDGTQIIGTTGATAIRVGVDIGGTPEYDAIGTLIQETNIAPTLETRQSSTTNDWNGTYSGTVPTPITLTASDVGPLATLENSGTVSVSGNTNFNYGVVSTDTVTRTFTIQNTSGGLISYTVTGLAAPFSIDSGGSATDLAAGATQDLVIDYDPTTAAEHTDTFTIDLTSGTDETVDISGIGVQLQGTLSWNADTGTLVSPIVDSGSYISQPDFTSFGSNGKAVYAFTISTAGFYKIATNVSAADTESNSFYIGINQDPEFNVDIWDVDVTSGIEAHDISRRGSGTEESQETDPMIWELDAGVHFLVVWGREGGTRLQDLTITQTSTPVSPNVRYTNRREGLLHSIFGP